jgi:hypothetical protein
MFLEASVDFRRTSRRRIPEAELVCLSPALCRAVMLCKWKEEHQGLQVFFTVVGLAASPHVAQQNESDSPSPSSGVTLC